LLLLSFHLQRQAYSFGSLAEGMMDRKIIVNHVAPMQPVPAFSEHPSRANVLPVFASFDMFDSPMDMTKIVRMFDIKLVSIEEFGKKMTAGS
jgi:hypothetical protein